MTGAKQEFPLPEGFELEVLDGDIHNPAKQGAEWYRVNSGGMTVAAVKSGEHRATIEAVGDMDIRRVLGPSHKSHARYSDELPKLGITTDAELEAAYAQDGAGFEIVNNPWFEAWLGEDFSEPCFSVGEAIESAVELINAENQR